MNKDKDLLKIYHTMIKKSQNQVLIRNLKAELTPEQLLPLFEKVQQIKFQALLKAAKRMKKNKKSNSATDESVQLQYMYDQFYMNNGNIDIDTILANIKKQQLGKTPEFKALKTKLAEDREAFFKKREEEINTMMKEKEVQLKEAQAKDIEETKQIQEE